MAPALTHQPPRALGYLRVSTTEQADSGAGLAAQRAAIQSEADRRGWEVEFLADEGYSAKDLNRPALTEALARLDRHEVDALMVSKIDRLSRSVHDFTGLRARADKRGWSLVLLDVNVDTSTPSGTMMANIMSSFSEYERALIGQRTKDALAAKKAAGIRLGRPRLLPQEVVASIVEAKAAGRSLASIARNLTAQGVPTAQGGQRWYASTIAAVLRSVELDMPVQSAKGGE